MKKIIINKLTDFIIHNKKCDDKDIKIYRYGLEALYNLVTKTIVILIITHFTKSTKECLLFILFYTFLRIFSYGLHASSSLTCWITTLPIYVGGSLLIKYLTAPKNVVIALWIIYILFVILWAPADTKKRPLIREKRRKLLKIESLIITIIYLLLIIFIKNKEILNAIFFSMILEGICICPLTYKITNSPFNNYITYLEEHGLN